ncbi:pectin lyase fold protein [Vibrio phage 1.276.O._10N.286.54.E4]|nr:pectin lyase fold protein [Vibrio phage 1.276.O._10N.286.54.E4]
MTIPKITPYSGGVANPDGSQTQTEFTQNMFDQLSYEAELSTELNNTIDGINDTATQVDSDATSAAQSAAAAEAAVSGLSYQGLWPDTGGSADKGDTYQTQVSGTPTGQYFTALQNTTVDPVGDDVNWRSVVSGSSIGLQEVIATGSTAPRALSDRFSDIKSVRDDRVAGDGVADDTAALEGLPAGAYHMPDGEYVIDGATLPKTLRFIMSQGARFKAINNPSEINSVIDAVNQPVDWKYVNNCKINQYDITVGTDKDFQEIQEAIDFVPSNMWQRFVARVDDGDYSSEHLNVDGKIARSTNIDLDNSISGEHTGLFIVGNTTNPENVKIGSFLAVSCYGATFQPQLSGCDMVSTVPKTNEGASVEFYGCSNGAVLDVNFSAVGGDKGIMAYGGSNVSVENVDFGDQIYNDLFVTKHCSHISSNSNTRQGVGKSPTGTAKRYVSNPISGSIHFNDMSGLKSASFDRVRQGGNMNGFTYNAAEQTLYGPMQLNDSPSNYQTYFTNLDSFSHTESLVDSTTSIDATKGLNLHCGSVPNAFSQAFLRRDNTLSTQNIIYRQQLKAAVSFPSMSGAFLELGIGFGNGRAYFEVGETQVRGIFVDFSGVSTNVVLCDTSDIVGDKCVFDLSVERDNSTASTQLANIRFKISTKTFEFYKAINSVAGSIENTYEWYTKIQSVDGSERDVYIGELSLYRS